MEKHYVGYMKKTFLLVILIAVYSVSAFPQNKQNKIDNAGIQKVIESFRKSIIERNKPLFLSLFFDGNIIWQAVMEDKSLAQIKLKRPQAIKARLIPDNNHLNFIDSILKDEKSNEEKFSQIKILTDGDVASVNFDYIYLTDKVEQNRGREIWLLVRTESGWKITSVNYSIILPTPK